MNGNPSSAAFTAAAAANAETYPPPPATSAREPGTIDPLSTMISDIGILGDASLHYGARLLVIRELLKSLCRHAPIGLQSAIADDLRAGTERILARTDERPLPDAFYHALLDEMNRYLEHL